MAKSNELSRVPKGYVASAKRRQKLLSKLYPQDKNVGEVEVANARSNFLASTDALFAGKEEMPLRNRTFIDEFIEGIMGGLSTIAVCEKLEVPRSLYTYWMLAAGKGESPYADFAKEVIGAEAKYEEELIKSLKMSHGSSWTKYKFLLEVHRPERWSAAAIKAKTDLEYNVPKDESANPETLRVEVFHAMLPDNGRDGREVINITPKELADHRQDAKDNQNG